MNAYRSPLRRITALAALALAASVMAGCAKKMTSVDPGYALDSTYVSDPTHGGVEGLFSTYARLVVYPNVALSMDSIYDKPPIGEKGPEDSLVTTWVFPLSPTDMAGHVFTDWMIPYVPAGLHGLVFDSTVANAYQVLRRESNGGFALLKDYPIPPVTRLLETQWEVFAFEDARPSGYNPPTYVGRGVVAGTVSRTSPLTNLGKLTGRDMPDIAYLGNRAPTDSNFTLRWSPVSGAAGYWIQIYQFGSGVSEAVKFLSSQPAPFLASTARSQFVAYMPVGITQYELGQPYPPGSLVLYRKPLLMAREYFVRISAVNAQGQMIAFSRGDYRDYWYINGAGSGYYRYQMGAARVTPKRPT